MTIPSTARKAGPFDGTGVQTEWPFTFKVFTETDVKVAIADAFGVTTDLVYLTDFTVALNADQETSPGGTVTYPISGTPLPDDGSVLSIAGNATYEQALDLPSGGNFSPLAIENALDAIVMQIQQLAEEISRAARLPITSAEDAESLVADIVVLADNVTNMQTLVANIADIVTVADDLNEPVSEIETVAASIDNVDTVGLAIAAVNIVAAAITAVNTVSAAIANVNTVATNIANVNTVAGISANVTTVAGVAANVTTVAGISADVSTVAGIDTEVSSVAAVDAEVVTVSGIAANVTTVAGISGGVTTVATNVVDVNTVATNIADVGTVADNIADVTAVAADIANIDIVAGNATDIDTVAANIAAVNNTSSNMAAVIDAPNQASAAAASAVSAANSAAAAATALDNFDDRYLGQKTADPTLDNDGMALITGALCFNTTTGKMRVYTGSGWIDASSASVATLATFNYVATAGQTTFSGNDAAGVNLVYTVGAVIVTLNGIDQKNGVDYTASNGSSIVLTSGAAAGDELRVYAFGNFQVADTYSQAAADAKFLAKTGGTMSGELVVPSLKGATGNKLQLRSGDSSYGVSLQNISGIDLLAVDASGRVTTPYQPSVTIQKIDFVQGGSSWNEVTGYGAAQHNIGSHFNTTTGRFTCPVAGKYLVTCNQRSTDGSGQDKVARLQLWVNGANSMNGDYWAAYAASYGGSVRGTVSASNVFNCYAGDTLSAATFAGASVMAHVLSVTYLG